MELDTSEALAAQLATNSDLSDAVVQGVDLSGVDLEGAQVEGTIFLGCSFKDPEQHTSLIERGASVFPRLPDALPYTPFRRGLYTVEELMEGDADGGYAATRDFRIYAHFDRARRGPHGPPLRERLAQRIHDHAIDDALGKVLAKHSGRGVVGVMGGHGTKRSDPYFLKVAQLTWRLTRAGYYVASGGGPGIMEATNLGAFFANYSDPAVLEAVVEELSAADKFDGGQAEGTPAYLQAIKDYFAIGRRVLATYTGDVDPALAARFGREREAPGASLAIPTWFYGHEPSNLWSTHIAKYFSNSLREDGLLAIATAGVIYAPGSAGTLQEIFMDLAQNHYATFKLRSPMVFLGEQHYAEIMTLLRSFVASKNMQDVYGDLITVSDDPAWIAEFVANTPPRPREEKTPLYELL